jgi:hypothetical protein
VIKGSDDPDSLRGLNANGVFFDEWAQCKPEAYGEIFRPILAQNGGWAMFGFTPKGRNHAYEFWRRGCVADSEWKSFDLLASTSGLIKDDELAKARVEMGEALYSQEMECEFLADAASVFGGLDECVVGSLEDSVPGHAYVIGVDLGRHHDATVLTCMDRMRRHVVAYVRLTENHWALQKTAIAELARRYNNALCVVEENSFGSPIIEDLREMGVSVQGFKTTSASKGGLIDGLRVAIAQRQVTFPRIEQMLRELQEYEIEITPLGNIRYHAPEGEGYFDDSVMSLALCVSGLGAERYAPRYDDVAYDLASFEVPVNGGYRF